jgi:hypothetical protein
VYKELLFQVRGFLDIQVTYNITCNICNLCVQYEKKYSLLCRLKTNHMMEEGNRHLFLAQWTLRLLTGTTSLTNWKRGIQRGIEESVIAQSLIGQRVRKANLRADRANWSPARGKLTGYQPNK